MLAFAMLESLCFVAYDDKFLRHVLISLSNSSRFLDPFCLFWFPFYVLSNSCVAFSLVLDRQIHANPSRSQANTLLLVHTHARVISLKKRGVHALRSKVGNGLGSGVSAGVGRCRILGTGSE